MTKLSDTQRVILSAAAQHEMGLAQAPNTLPVAARNAVFRSLIKNNLLAEINAPREHVGLGWRQDEAGSWIAARITDEGLHAIGIDLNEADVVAEKPPTAAPDAQPQPQGAPAAEAAQAAPLAQGVALPNKAFATHVAMPRRSLRDADMAVLAAWDDEANRAGDMISALDASMKSLRALLAGKPACMPRAAGTPRKPREGTKQERVLAMLRRPEGATIAQVMQATGWQQHTVRGFFAGLKMHQGIEVAVLERIRQIGPNKAGAKGSYSIYHVAGAQG